MHRGVFGQTVFADARARLSDEVLMLGVDVPVPDAGNAIFDFVFFRAAVSFEEFSETPKRRCLPVGWYFLKAFFA